MAKFKKPDIKKITRFVTVGVFALSIAILGATAWFVIKTLNVISASTALTSGNESHVEFINLSLLNKLEENAEGKTSIPGPDTSKLNNPFATAPATGAAPLPAAPPL